MSAVAYALVKNGSSVDATEVERTDADVVDVMLSWGEGSDRTVLGVKHLAANEELTVGEGEDCDFLVPERVLGAKSARVLARMGDKIVIVPPAGAKLLVDGLPSMSVSLDLGKAQVAEVVVGGFTLRFNVVAAPKKVAAFIETSKSTLASVTGSAFFHVALIAAAAFLGMNLGADDSANADRQNQQLIQASVDLSAYQEEQQVQTPDDSGSEKASPDPSAAGQPGHIGKTDSPALQGKLQIAGDSSQPKSISREQQLDDAKRFGIVGLIGALNAQTGANAMASKWPTNDVTNGGDDSTTLGNMFTGIPGEAMGSNGLSLSKPGEDGGFGPGNWYNIASPGQGTLGTCVGESCFGGTIGTDRSKQRIGHKVTAPNPIPIPGSVNGHLPPEVIQRVIQQNAGRFQACYANGLQMDPSLTGAVRATFVIDRNGAVSFASYAGGDLPNAGVQQCVVAGFRSLSFPAPSNGTVSVTYGFNFVPSNS
jgi:hypothetical protein